MKNEAYWNACANSVNKTSNSLRTGLYKKNYLLTNLFHTQWTVKFFYFESSSIPSRLLVMENFVTVWMLIFPRIFCSKIYLTESNKKVHLVWRWRGTQYWVVFKSGNSDVLQHSTCQAFSRKYLVVTHLELLPSKYTHPPESRRVGNVVKEFL